MSQTHQEILQREVSYSGEGISVRSLETSISQERTRQNQNVEALSRLRQRNSEIQQALGEEVKKLKDITKHLSQERERGDFMSGVREVLAKLPWFGEQIITRRSIEELLRKQYELSSRRVKEAAEFADRLEAAKSDLFDEIERLNQKIVESAKNEEVAAERVLELTKLKDSLEVELMASDRSSSTGRELQAQLDRARRKLAKHSTMLKLYSTAEERLAKLQKNTRQLAETIAHLQSDITVYVTAASEKLDLIAGQIQAIGAAADASVVMLELRNSLEAMTESVNHTTRFVSETQAYFRQNVDTMLDDLQLYDAETEHVLESNLAINQGYDDLQIADAVSSALSQKIERAAQEVTLEDVKEATIEDLEKMRIK
ncbi:hypothetical protein FIV42_19215 [Persicimonas caeni]|uniref:Gliding motility-associated protein GldM N-terminal domain-containing protein n=1 Tax=Persicimonas caeni TaxID=2292766 RepID=A0A4Y6PYH1_PERCE|nr:hypothetical protein [Persicimonas caeni]QDG52795.1 hypothetical protein FIV42_19215 [Persicimonas caeni]QED34017.1 hypothetical protein FRD00_19210 [Persicimonas caeni]